MSKGMFLYCHGDCQGTCKLRLHTWGQNPIDCSLKLEGYFYTTYTRDGSVHRIKGNDQSYKLMYETPHIMLQNHRIIPVRREL